jgi:hypothetical protein
VLAEQQRRPADGKEGLGEVELADPGGAPGCQQRSRAFSAAWRPATGAPWQAAMLTRRHENLAMGGHCSPAGEDTEEFFARPGPGLALIRPARKDENAPR